MKRRLDRRGGRVELRLKGPDLLAWRGAAYALTARAYVALGRSGGAEAAFLRPKRKLSLDRLADAFERHYADQARLWAAARAGRSRRVEILQRALAFADASGARRASAAPRAAALSAEQAAEIASLLAEAEAAPKDPLGIAATWEEVRRR